MRLKLILKLMFVLLLSASITGHAQVNTATMLGSVTDSAGAAIPDATVTITQPDTNYSRSVKSDAQGQYRAEFLPVGVYSVKTEASGFKTTVRNAVTLTVMQEAKVDFSLQIGTNTETVTVTTDLPLLNTSNATISRTVDNKEIDNLPLVNRNVYQLLTLTPGVQSSSTQNTLGYPEQHTIINGSTDSTVGQVSYYLDGGSNMTGLRNTGNILPNPDAIREFVVQTNNFSAQYGRTSSGIVSVLTKSGTNRVHGSVFEFNRNTVLNATTHNSTLNLPYHRNQFGATMGGPFAHDKTFFFGSYAGLRQSTGSLLTSAVVPDEAQRSGDFSENLPTASGAIKSCQQTLASADAKAGRFIVCNPTTRKPYLGNIITDPLDPTTQQVFARNLPLPNMAGNRWQGFQTLPYQGDEFLIKVDHQLTPAHRLSAAYFQTNGNQEQIPSSGNVVPWSLQQFTWRQQNANLNDVWTVNPSTANQFWASYTRMIAGRTNLPALSLADYGSTFQIQGPPQLPQIAVSGYFTLAQQIAGPIAGTNVYGLRDVLSTTHGKHSLYLGGEFALEKDAQNTLLNDYGVFSYSSSKTARTGNALADFILGRPNTMNQDAPVYTNANYFNYGLFAQDDYHILPGLILNLGLRYDVQTAPTITQNRIAGFRLGEQSTVSPTAITGQLFPGDRGVPRSGVDTRWNHVSPRVGAAWDPFGNGKTVVHAAGGLFFGTISGNEWELPSNSQPFSVRAQYNHVVSMTNVYATDAADFPGGVSPYPYNYSPSSPRYIEPASLIVFPQNYKWPYSYQINFGVQQQITNTLALSLSYVGALSRKLPIEIDRNYPLYNAADPSANTTSTANTRRPIQPGTISTLLSVESGESSNYHGLQVTMDKRFSRSFSFKSYFVWSKTLASIAMDNNSLANTFEDYNLRSLDRQRSDFDQRLTSTSSIVWQPDYFSRFNPLVRNLLNGWTTTAIVTLQSGAPFSITTGSDNNGDGNNNDRPNVIRGQQLAVINARRSRTANMAQWFNTATLCSFDSTAPTACPGTGPAGSDGLVSPNLLDAPGVRNVDASLFRNFKFGEFLTLQFRSEVANVFNLTNLGNPNGTLSSPNFGKITGSATGFPNRQIQLGARILF